MDKIREIQKAVSAMVTGVIGWGFVVVASTSASITAAEWLGLAVAVATGLGVYAVPNIPSSHDEDGDAE